MNPAGPNPELHEIDSLIPLGISGDLAPGDQAEFDARVAADPAMAEEATAMREALAPLHRLRNAGAVMPSELAVRVKSAVLGSLPTADSIEAGTDVPGFAPSRQALHEARLSGEMPASVSGRVVAAAMGSLPTADSIEAGRDVAGFEQSREQLRGAQVARPMPPPLAERVSERVMASLPSADEIEAGTDVGGVGGFADLRSLLRGAQPQGSMPANLAARVTANVLATRKPASTVAATASASPGLADALSSDEHTVPAGRQHSIFHAMRNPAVAALVILSLGLGLLLLPDPQTTPGGPGNAGTASNTPAPATNSGAQPQPDTPDAVVNANPNANANPGTPQDVPRVLIGAAHARSYGGEELNAVSTSRSTDHGLPHAMKAIEGDRQAAGVPMATAGDTGSFRLPEGDALADDATISGDF